MSIEVVEQPLRIEVLSTGIIEWRTDKVIFDDGVEIGRSAIGRTIRVPGADTSNDPDMIKEIAATVHTPERIQAFADLVAAEDHTE